MVDYKQHFNAVALKAKTIKPPSKIQLVLSGLLALSTIIAFVVAICCFIIGIIVWITYEYSALLFGLSKYGIYYSFGAWIFVFLLVRDYTKKVAAYKNTTILRSEFKFKILPALIKELYSDISFEFDGIVDEFYIIESGIFDSGFIEKTRDQWFFGDDYFKGKIKNVDFEFCELYCKTEGLTNTGRFFAFFLIALSIVYPVFLGDLFEVGATALTYSSDLREEREGFSATDNGEKQKAHSKALLYGVKTNFRGFFLYADFHKQFDGEVQIRTRKKLSFRKMFNSSKKLKEVRPENAAVRKKYKIVATDQQMAYYVLSPAIIDAIEQLHNRLGKDLSMTLKNGKLYLAVPMNKDFFENITVEEKIVKVNSLEAIKEDLNVVQNLITELNISNRIWTKT